MSRAALRSRVPQLRTSNPDALRQDLGRAQGDLDQLLFALQEGFLPRLQFGRKVTAHTERASCRLRFGEAPLVDTRDGAVRLYLPRATSDDAGRPLGFLKQIPSGAVHLQPVDGQLINGLSSWPNVTRVGFHYIQWDGSGWRIQESTGRAQAHATTPDTLGLWQLNARSLEDSSGHGRTLTIETGTERFSYVDGTLGGFYFDGSTALWYNVADSALRLTGDMTFMSLFLLESVTAGAYWFSHTAAGELEAQNQLYGLQYNAVSAPTLAWIQENGAGVNSAGAPANNYMPVSVLSHMAVTRASNVVTTYLQGRRFGDPTAALTTPTGGSDGRLRLGGDATTRIRGVMSSAQLISRALSSTEVMAARNYTLGGAQGYIDAY